MHAQFIADARGRNVFLILVGKITDHKMVMEIEMARVKETAQGEATPTIQTLMNQMMAIVMVVKEMAPATTSRAGVTQTTVIVKVETTILTIETVTNIIWQILGCLIGIRNDW